MSVVLPQTIQAVDPAWIDYNGHMNLSYYVLAFDQATDTFHDVLGIGLDYRERLNSSMFTLAINVDYIREVFAHDQLRITTQLLDCDAKRMRYFHQMYQGEPEHLVATNECLAVHVDMASRRSAPFPEPTRARIEALLAAHRQLPMPERAGRVLGVRA